MLTQMLQSLRGDAARAGRALRPWLPVMLMAIVCLIPAAAGAQGTMFDQATSWLGQATTVVGWVLIIGGLLLLLAGGWGVKEGRGGWAPMAVGIVIVFIGYKVVTAAGNSGSLNPTSIFGQ